MSAIPSRENQDLREAMRSWCKAAFAFLEARVLAGEQIPKKAEFGFSVVRHNHSGDGSRISTSREITAQVENFDVFVNQTHYENLLKLPEYDKASTALGKLSSISTEQEQYIGTCLGVNQFNKSWLLLQLLKNLWSQKRSIAFDETGFVPVYSSFESYLLCPQLQTKIIVLLEGMNVESLKISQDVELKLLDDADLQRMYASDWTFRETYKSRLTDIPNVALIIRKLEDRVTVWTSGVNEAKQRAEEIISVLRIFQPQPISYQLIEYFHSPEEWIPGPSALTEARPHVYDSAYQLSVADEMSLASLLQKFRSVSWHSQGALGVAVRRLSLGADRRWAEDKLLDYSICLEALFGNKNAEGEISFQLALRGAWFLRSNQTDRKLIFEFLRNAYGERSSIVHGRPRQVPESIHTDPLNPMVRQLETHLCVALQRFVEIAADGRKGDLVNWKEVVLGNSR